MLHFSSLIAIVLLATSSHGYEEVHLMQFDPELGEKLNAQFWQKQSLDTLDEKLSNLKKMGFKRTNSRRAKNIILFLGDGMGIATVTAARKYKEQFSGEPFYRNKLAWDSFPFSGFAKTYGLDIVVAESAGTATAYHSGVKTRLGFIGLDASADLTCKNSSKGRLESIASRAVKAGKSAGFVTTTSITDASPSGVYANMPAPLRRYQFATEVFSKNYPNCEDIAKQFVTKGHFLKVAMGGGWGAFFPNNMTIPDGDNATRRRAGLRNDGRNLVEEWLLDRSERSRSQNSAFYVTSRQDLLAIDPKKVDYLLGMFNFDHLNFMDDNPPRNEPTLTEMTTAAVKILSQNNDKGFFLFVEGGRIDHGHHFGAARYALAETVEFDKAIKAALEMTDPRETLVVVTADHSHSLSLSGYIGHNSSVLGTSVELADDQKPYSALIYANGPGASLKAPDGTRRNDSLANMIARGYRQQSAVPLPNEGHGGEDVPVYAIGPYSEFFTGVFEQSFLPWAMACAGGIHYGPSGTILEEMKALCPLHEVTNGGKNSRVSLLNWIVVITFCYWF